MYKLEKRDFGIWMELSGTMDLNEMKKWVEDSKKILSNVSGNFGVFADIKALHPIDSETQKVMLEGQKLYKEKGLQRSAVILNTPTTTMQFKKIAKQTGISNWERYFDASSNTNWEKSAIDWIVNGKDPEK